MKVGNSMTSDVRVMNPDETIRAAAEIMANMDIGLLPVSENDRLVGMISDRDIAVRGVAAGKGPNTRIGEVMTYDVKYCFDDQDIDEVLENMADLQVRRLPVLDRAKRLIGIVSLGDLARRGSLTAMALAASHGRGANTPSRCDAWAGAHTGVPYDRRPFQGNVYCRAAGAALGGRSVDARPAEDGGGGASSCTEGGVQNAP